MTDQTGVSGFRELEQALEQVARAAGKNTLRRSLKKAAEPMVNLMKANAPVGPTGNLKGSIRSSTGLSKRQARVHRGMFRDDRASVEVFVGAEYFRAGKHAHLVEFGTAPHMNGGKFKGTMNPGMPPQPFIRPAWDQDHKALLERLGKDMWAEIEKTIARAERKAARQAAKG